MKPLSSPYLPSTNDPSEEEEKRVHQVYESIASHFSQTRFKPWPLIKTFLEDQPPGSLGLDSGAGNGKYLSVAHSAGSNMIALDRSSGLLSIAQKQGWQSSYSSATALDTSSTKNEPSKIEDMGNLAECVRADMSMDVWREGIFDFAISIAAVHHLSTSERRQKAVQVLLRPLRLSRSPPYARFMIYVWAFEQGKDSRRKMGSTAVVSSEGGTELRSDGATTFEKVQDVLVPWVLRPIKGESNRKVKSQPQSSRKNQTQSGSSPSFTHNSPSSVLKDKVSAYSGCENDQDGEIGGHEKAEEVKKEPKIFYRYYHLFTKDELYSLVESAAVAESFEVLTFQSQTDVSDASRGNLPSSSELNLDQKDRKWLKVRGIGWEADNWWIEGEVGLF
ncbi:hypothetical protein L204_102256 [Cryptococcus depauperatus]|nr:hypothetical protein L204_04754 [Cryptococcus depauperatus CBS 7855]